jgi:hypothetical protein
MFFNDGMWGKHLMHDPLQPVLYECIMCHKIKCNTCTNGIVEQYPSKNTPYPEPQWISFINRRGHIFHICSKKCNDSWEELD